MGQFRLLQIGFDPGLPPGDDREYGLAGLDIFAGLQFDIADDAADRSMDNGAFEIEPGRIAQRLLLPVHRVALDRRIERSAQFHQHPVHPLPGHLRLLANHLCPLTGDCQIVLRRFQLDPGRGAAPLQTAKPFHLRLVVANGLKRLAPLALRYLQLACRDVIFGPQAEQFVAHHSQFRLGAGEANLDGDGIDPEEQVAGADFLMVAHGDIHDPSLDIGADLDDVVLHIGVFGRHIASAGEIDIGSHRYRGERNHDQQEQAGQGPAYAAQTHWAAICRSAALAVWLLFWSISCKRALTVMSASTALSCSASSRSLRAS